MTSEWNPVLLGCLKSVQAGLTYISDFFHLCPFN